ncbi:MAG: DUF6766 family protein [Phycisphaerales bacterium]
MKLLHAHKHGFLWVTACFFLISLSGHWLFGWLAFRNEARSKGVTPNTADYAVEITRDTLENWQSEFLQLIWQVAGLSFLLHVGSSQSKEGQERVEAKIDYLLSLTPGGDSEKQRLDQAYFRDG